MITDSISDMLIRIKNGYLAEKRSVVVPYSKYKERLAKLLQKAGFLGNVQVVKKSKVKKDILLELVYIDKKPKLSKMKVISKASRRIYVTKDELPKVLGGLGVAIISTSSGLMTDEKARKKGLGGEVICEIW